MARFYHLSITELEQLPVTMFNEFWEYINILEAQEMLVQCKAVDFAYMKDSPKKEFWANLKRKASIDNESNKLQTPQDIAKAIGMIQNGR